MQKEGGCEATAAEEEPLDAIFSGGAGGGDLDVKTVVSDLLGVTLTVWASDRMANDPGLALALAGIWCVVSGARGDYDPARLNLWQPKEQIEEEVYVAARTWLFAAPLQLAVVLAFWQGGDRLPGLPIATPGGDLTPEVEVIFSLLFLLPPWRGIWFAVAWLTGR